MRAMNLTLKTSAVLLGGLLLTTACGGKVPTQAGDAAPAGSPSATTSPAATASVTTSADSSPPAAAKTSASPAFSSYVLGPNGLGPLKLGLTWQQANATGLIFPAKGSAAQGCEIVRFRGAPADDPQKNTGGHVFLNGNKGVVAIEAFDPATKTPQGIHLGSSINDVKRVYPQWNPIDETPNGDGRGGIPDPGNDNAHFRVVVTGGKVTELTLQRNDQGCYE